MKTTLEISRASILMAVSTMSTAFPGKKPIMISMLEKKVADFLAKCPDASFRFTVESLTQPTGESV